MRIFFLSLLLLAPSLCAQRLVEHVFIVSFDGGKPSVIQESNTPVLKNLVREGAHTWSAETIFPPKTLPSHTSMFTGLQPAKHRVLWNNYQPEKGIILAPTIFTLARQSEPTLATALFSGKMKFRHLWQEGSLDLFYFKYPRSTAIPKGTEEIERSVDYSASVAQAGADYIVKNKPQLCGIHFADPDHAGHKFGWGSPEQKEAFQNADAALGILVNALKASGIQENSVLLISADHGGHGKTHGEKNPDDMLIPWIAWGKGVRPGFKIQTPVCTVDTAATALWLLGIPLPEQMDGKPVKEAFQFEKSSR